MKVKYLNFRKTIYVMSFAILCLFVYSSTIGIAMGQKKPGSLNQGTTADDKKLCERGNNGGSEFCGYYATYRTNVDSNPEIARKARNRMTDLVQSQIEIYYKARKDDRKRTVAILQTIFDVLEIGSAAAAGIIKGTLRAKTVIAQALSGFQAGRTAFNKNFDILQTQVLINTMNSNRAEIALNIEKSKTQSVDDYTWYKAKEDLIKLLNAGTFSDALDTLVKNTGERAANSEKDLANFKVTKKDVTGAISANVVLAKLEKDLADPAKEPDATKILRKAVTALTGTNADADIKAKLAAVPITATSSGKAIFDALKKIRRDFDVLDDRPDLVIKINAAINAAGGTID